MISVASTVIDAPLEDVWSWLDDFTSWHAWISRIDMTVMAEGRTQGPVGSVRILHREDGTVIREKLVMKDDLRHTMAYCFDGPHPYPVRRYVGTVRLEPVTTTGATYVHWSGDFDADAADELRAAELFRSVYTAFFGYLAERTGAQLASS
jgi:Polyketide cyclase / dehydrase and lipid transport